MMFSIVNGAEIIDIRLLPIFVYAPKVPLERRGIKLGSKESANRNIQTMMCDDDDARIPECVADDDDRKAKLEQSFTADYGTDDDDSSSDSDEGEENHSAGAAESSGQTYNAAYSAAYDDGFLKSVLRSMEQSSIRRRTAKKRRVGRTFKSDFKYEMEHMTTQLSTQQRLCAVSFLPFTLQRLSDWQLSPDRYDNDEDYIPPNVRLVCLEFNNRCSWSSADITEFHRLALLPLDDAYVAKAIASARQVAQIRQKAQSQPSVDGKNEEWKCFGLCGQFVELGCMSKGSKTLCKPCDVKRDREYRKTVKVSGSKRKRRTPLQSKDGDWMCFGCDEFKPEDQLSKGSKTLCKKCQNKSYSSSVNAELRSLLSSAINATNRRNEKIKKRNKKRHRNDPLLKCTITLDELVRIYEQQRTRCYYSGASFQHRSLLGKGEVLSKLRQMSLERLDPRRGYELDNVRLICLGFQSIDCTRDSKYSNGGSGGWSKLKVQYLFQVCPFATVSCLVVALCAVVDRASGWLCTAICILAGVQGHDQTSSHCIDILSVRYCTPVHLAISRLLSWPASWSILSAIITILFLFSSAFALSLLYHQHNQWKKLKRGRHLIYTQCEKIVPNDISSQMLLLNGPLGFRYELWPGLEEECRAVRIHSACLFRLSCACVSHTMAQPILCPAPELVASTRDNSLSAKFMQDDTCCADDCVDKRHLHVQAAPFSRNRHDFDMVLQLVDDNGGGGGGGGGAAKLEICFATTCDSSFSKDGTENLVYHNVCLYGKMP